MKQKISCNRVTVQVRGGYVVYENRCEHVAPCDFAKWTENGCAYYAEGHCTNKECIKYGTLRLHSAVGRIVIDGLEKKIWKSYTVITPKGDSDGTSQG